MTETTKTILSVLAGAGSGVVAQLPLAEDLYPRASLQVTAAAFSQLCRVEFVSQAPRESVITLLVEPQHCHEGRRVTGEFLNYLLRHAVRESQRHTAEAP
jgi:hypothetical protein